jgi:hypothetical protein
MGFNLFSVPVSDVLWELLAASWVRVSEDPLLVQSSSCVVSHTKIPSLIPIHASLSHIVVLRRI